MYIKHKKSFIIIQIFLFILLAGALSAEEIAIIPYRVNNPSIYLPEKTGEEYAKLLALVSRAKKGVKITSPVVLKTDLNRLGIKPQGTITGEDLNHLGRQNHIDYILIGSLSRVGKQYISESRVYSVKGKERIAKFRVKSKSLFRLAEEEVSRALAQYEDINLRDEPLGKQNMDALFLIDTSYKINCDWKAVKKSILSFSSQAIDTMGINTRVYLVPFSDRVSYNKSRVTVNSISLLRTELNRLKPVGKTGAKSFRRALRYAVKNTRWRKEAGKILFIISNSNLNKTRFPQQYSIIARKRGVRIYTLALGDLTAKNNTVLQRLAQMTGGKHYTVSYHQRLYDHNGNKVEVYMQKKRLFTSKIYYREWKEGLLTGNKFRASYGKPRDFLDEIYYDKKKYRLKPDTIAEVYPRITGEYVVNNEKLETNLEQLFKNIWEAFYNKNRIMKKSVGKVLLSDGKISFWVYVRNRKSFDFYRNRKRFYFPLGVEIRKDRKQPYGIAFVPRITNVQSGNIPAMVTAKLSNIIKKRGYYMSKGMLYPPIWFVRVKVENIKSFKKVKDIRD
ncbi:MAG: VWA domain-containing protein [bacterium]|nr:VWA domain-containing protein [bacterium]